MVTLFVQRQLTDDENGAKNVKLVPEIQVLFL